MNGPPAQNRTAILVTPDAGRHNDSHHPENQRRLDAVCAHLTAHGLFDNRPRVAFGAVSLTSVERVHNPWYVERLEQLSHAGGGRLDADTYVGPDSYDVALMTVGASVAAVDAVLDGAAGAAFVLGRPPGHHATPERGMGFCLLNNVGIAAGHALDRGLQRVAIIDWDVHHGNGTQDMFYDSGQVLFCSVHQTPFYPGSGASDETGRGHGEGLTINVPLLAGQGDDNYQQVFEEIFLPALMDYQPELLLISAGYDAHRDDPIGGMRVSGDGFGKMADLIASVADTVAGGRLVATLEGGYDPAALALSVHQTLLAMDGRHLQSIGLSGAGKQ